MLLVVLWIILGTVALLAFVVPDQFSERQNFSLDPQNVWTQSVCVPNQGFYGTFTTNVSFAWSTRSPSSIMFQVSYVSGYRSGPSGLAPIVKVVYNGSGPSGSGSYVSGPNPGNGAWEEFSMAGILEGSVSSVSVNLSYVLPGHYIGGAYTDPCDF